MQVEAYFRNRGQCAESRSVPRMCQRAVKITQQYGWACEPRNALTDRIARRRLHITTVRS